MTVKYDSSQAVYFLGTIIICLIVANIAGIVSMYYFGYSRLDLFNLDEEYNIPSLYASLTILFCAWLLAVIAIARKRQKNSDYLYWTALSVIFIFLSADEFFRIHERLMEPLRNALHTSGVLYFAWVIPYGIFVIILMLIYFRFLFSLAVRIRCWIILAGVIYIGGAIGLELVGGYWSQLYGEKNVTYALITTLEESLEMAGILAFIYALMSYINSELNLRVHSSI